MNLGSTFHNVVVSVDEKLKLEKKEANFAVSIN